MNLSINDAAALLIQIEPDDVSELANLQGLLTAIAEDKEHSEPFREKIVQAGQLIGEIIDSSVSDPLTAVLHILTITPHSDKRLVRKVGFLFLIIKS